MDFEKEIIELKQELEKIRCEILSRSQDDISQILKELDLLFSKTN